MVQGVRGTQINNLQFQMAKKNLKPVNAGRVKGTNISAHQLQTQKSKLKPTQTVEKTGIKKEMSSKTPKVSKTSTMKKVLKIVGLSLTVGLSLGSAIPIANKLFNFPILDTIKNDSNDVGKEMSKGMDKIAKSKAFQMAKKGLGISVKGLATVMGPIMEGMMQTDWTHLFQMMDTVPDSQGMAARKGDTAYFEGGAYGGGTSSSTGGTLRNAWG